MCGRYDNLIPRDAYSALFFMRLPRSNFTPRLPDDYDTWLGQNKSPDESRGPS